MLPKYFSNFNSMISTNNISKFIYFLRFIDVVNKKYSKVNNVFFRFFFVPLPLWPSLFALFRNDSVQSPNLSQTADKVGKYLSVIYNLSYEAFYYYKYFALLFPVKSSS